MKRETKKDKIIEFDPNLEDLSYLLKIYANVQNALIGKKASVKGGKPTKVFSTGNIVGEYAEILICEKLGYTQQIASNEGFDAIDDTGNHIQIKSRWLGCSNNQGRTSMGAVKKENIDNGELNYIFTILFNDDFSIKAAYLIPAKEYGKLASLKKDNYILDLNDSKIEHINEKYLDYGITIYTNDLI